MKKGNIIEKTKLAVKRLHEQHIMIVGGMIIGNPNDREEDIARNYEFFVESQIDFLRWKYNKKHANYICTTPAFIKKYPLAYYYRQYFRRPFLRLKNVVSGNKPSERELYRKDMAWAVATNKFF